MKLSNCPVHAIMLDKARESMAAKNLFRKDEILHASGFAAYARYIQWPYIRDTVSHELGEPLTPVSEQDGRWNPSIHPEKFLPGGKRKTVGYARATALDHSVTIEWAKRRHATAVGTWKTTEALLLAYQKQGVPIGFTPVALPKLSLPAPDQVPAE